MSKAESEKPSQAPQSTTQHRLSGSPPMEPSSASGSVSATSNTKPGSENVLENSPEPKDSPIAEPKQQTPSGVTTDAKFNMAVAEQNLGEAAASNVHALNSNLSILNGAGMQALPGHPFLSNANYLMAFNQQRLWQHLQQQQQLQLEQQLQQWMMTRTLPSFVMGGVGQPNFTAGTAQPLPMGSGDLVGTGFGAGVRVAATPSSTSYSSVNSLTPSFSNIVGSPRPAPAPAFDQGKWSVPPAAPTSVPGPARVKRASSNSGRRGVRTACVPCHNAKLACDSGTPCQQCIKRDRNHLCVKDPLARMPPKPHVHSGADGVLKSRSRMTPTGRSRVNVVERACEPCRKGKLGCDVNTPCAQCVKRNRVDMCVRTPKLKGASSTGGSATDGPRTSAVKKRRVQSPPLPPARETELKSSRSGDDLSGGVNYDTGGNELEEEALAQSYDDDDDHEDDDDNEQYEDEDEDEDDLDWTDAQERGRKRRAMSLRREQRKKAYSHGKNAKQQVRISEEEATGILALTLASSVAPSSNEEV